MSVSLFDDPVLFFGGFLEVFIPLSGASPSVKECLHVTKRRSAIPPWTPDNQSPLLAMCRSVSPGYAIYQPYVALLADWSPLRHRESYTKGETHMDLVD
jgi:hypothetical protein